MKDFTKKILDVCNGKDNAESELYNAISEVIGVLNIKKRVTATKSKIKKVTRRETTEASVYDIGMKDTNNPYFFADGILVHNTDSTYFSAYPVLKEEIEKGEIEWDKDSIVKIYDSIATQVSDTFPDFLKETFNIPLNRSTGIIASSREVVAESALFIKKKRYAALIFDKEGVRKDINGKPGSVKAMGLDLRRSDTPKFVQDFLSDILLNTLLGNSETSILAEIREFKEVFDSMKPWEKGSPKAVNRLTHYGNLEIIYSNSDPKTRTSLRMPGHVSASLMWNSLRTINNDRHSMPILDGQKVIVCKLKVTDENKMSSIAYPVDEAHLPDWFLNLPFDEDLMLSTIIDKKVNNMLSVLKWDLSRTTKKMAHMETLFDFSFFDK